MASKLAHVIVSLLLGVGFVGLFGFHDVFYLILPVVALAGGLLPDYLEPASDAMHRKFWHSRLMYYALLVAFLLLLFFVSTERYPLLNNKEPNWLFVYPAGVLAVFIISWFFHLILDSKGAMGLPWVTGGRNKQRYDKNRRKWGL